MRLDIYLFNYKYSSSRQKAKRLVESGCVSVDGKIIKKPSFELCESEEHLIEIVDNCPYVSRGALKLISALDNFNLDIREKICLDIGSSTGGFTQVLLERGAKKVYAVDSGTDQLNRVLKEDSRVISIEGYNARNIRIDDIGECADIITIDVSFISQTYILPGAVSLLKENGFIVSLIKPQFEVGRSLLGKGGLVKDKASRLLAVERVVECANNNHLQCCGLLKSPIHGGDGNIEFLAIFSKNVAVKEINIKNIVFNT
ncbi:MAG: TlyA family RNA methyltransferase [Clostridia bacterium]|nr:TlyA family RNA methyltransferase [Clostridia bacterium]